VHTSERTIVAGLRLVRLVGSGGEGEVWESRDRAGRRRALKLIRPDALAEPETVRRRSRWLRRIRHPNLVRVHRSGLLDGGWGFVEMDFVDGLAVDQLPADPLVVDRLRPLAEALDLLHTGVWSGGRPVVHRDVKPSNIVEAGDGRLVLVDPSTLRTVDTAGEVLMGTPVYAAPEVLDGDVSPAADVYALAVTVVALLYDAHDDDLADLVADPDALDVPEGVWAALAPDPDDRPPSCRDVLA
jgi:eukaryotic-like serine/threonine-protein kinase